MSMKMYRHATLRFEKSNIYFNRRIQKTRDRYNPQDAAQRADFDRMRVAMKKSMFAVFSIAFLLSMGAFAQLGPAGVPGAPGLAPDNEEAASAPVKPRRALKDCSKSKNIKQCKTQQKARKTKKARQTKKSPQAAGKTRRNAVKPTDDERKNASGT
jgi:hypothetical protein